MTFHEIKPRQLRALLLLLVLVPFIPMVLMLRFMLDALEAGRDAEWERTAATYRQTLVAASSSLEKHLAKSPDAARPEQVVAFYQPLFDDAVAIRIFDASDRLLAGSRAAGGKLIVRQALKNAGLPWEVQAFLVDEAAINQTAREQFKIYLWTGLITALGICAIAAAAGLTVSRQFRLHELKNSSVATVAHELRTPLATMRMLVDTLREGRYRSAEQLREYLDLLHAENLRLSRLTEQFLTHSRLARGQQAFTFAPVAVRAIIDQALGALRGRLDAPGCAFTLELAEGLPEITGDREGLATVLINLLENALKYSGDDKRIALRARCEGDAIVFVVEDNGAGLSAAERRRIFEPFYQADQKLSRTREGVGLGLSIVQGIVEAHHGRLAIESQPGRGTVFTITIPLSSK